jgi:hypothetical protein
MWELSGGAENVFLLDEGVGPRVCTIVKAH